MSANENGFMQLDKPQVWRGKADWDAGAVSPTHCLDKLEVELWLGERIEHWE